MVIGNIKDADYEGANGNDSYTFTVTISVKRTYCFEWSKLKAWKRMDTDVKQIYITTTHLERRWRSSSNSLNMMTCLLFRSLTKFKVCLLTFLSAHRCSQTRFASCPSSCANLCAHSQIFTSAIQRHSMCEDLAMAMLLVHTVLAISVSRYDKPIAAIWWRRWQLCVRERLRNRFWLLVGNNES